MKNLLLLLISSIGSQAFSQCLLEGSQVPFDYCHTVDAFERYWAAFKDGEERFQVFINKKKTLSLPVTTTPDYEYLLRIASNKKLKVSAKDILFIESAVNTWSMESRKHGYDIDETGLGIKIISEGTGEYPKMSENVVVHYTGWLLDGKKFDSSIDRGTPFNFSLGKGQVIKGWDQGVAKMKVGTKALLKIPSELGYGASGAGRAIPPNATLIFEIEVLKAGE